MSDILSSEEFMFHHFEVSSLEGKLLTLIDASIADSTQRKAVKDLLRQQLWEWVYSHNPLKDDLEGQDIK